MLEFALLIVAPRANIVLGVKYTRVEELLGADICEVLCNLHLPIAEEAGLGKTLNKVVDAIETVLRLRNHVGAQVTHLVGVLGETSGQGSLVATRGDQKHILASLLKL